jgi:hypothetical protein
MLKEFCYVSGALNHPAFAVISRTEGFEQKTALGSPLFWRGIDASETCQDRDSPVITMPSDPNRFG